MQFGRAYSNINNYEPWGSKFIISYQKLGLCSFSNASLPFQAHTDLPFQAHISLF
jgi:hypothetical protein